MWHRISICILKETFNPGEKSSPVDVHEASRQSAPANVVIPEATHEGSVQPIPLVTAGLTPFPTLQNVYLHIAALALFNKT